MVNPNGKQMMGPQPLAVLAQGVFPDTYAGRDVPAWPAAAAADDAAAAPLATGPAPTPVEPTPGSLFLVGSAKMFDDNIIAAQQNALLLLNAVDFLAGSRDLLDIRSKSLTQRVIKPVAANEKMAWRIFVVLLVPVVLAAYGFVRAGMRRKDAARYRENLKHTTGVAR
jgi:ABC-type uncharacterized transport system involved in gliding motility auxiliary subunit